MIAFPFFVEIEAHQFHCNRKLLLTKADLWKYKYIHIYIYPILRTMQKDVWPFNAFFKQVTWIKKQKGSFDVFQIDRSLPMHLKPYYQSVNYTRETLRLGSESTLKATKFGDPEIHQHASKFYEKKAICICSRRNHPSGL